MSGNIPLRKLFPVCPCLWLQFYFCKEMASYHIKANTTWALSTSVPYPHALCPLHHQISSSVYFQSSLCWSLSSKAPPSFLYTSVTDSALSSLCSALATTSIHMAAEVLFSLNCELDASLPHSELPQAISPHRIRQPLDCTAMFLLISIFSSSSFVWVPLGMSICWILHSKPSFSSLCRLLPFSNISSHSNLSKGPYFSLYLK